jgi:hypothetical protein
MVFSLLIAAQFFPFYLLNIAYAALAFVNADFTFSVHQKNL